MIDPANYDFKGTRSISVIDPVDPEIPHEAKDDSKRHSLEKDIPSDPHTKSPPAQRFTDVSMEELQRVFRRAMWPSLISTVIVVVVRAISHPETAITSLCGLIHHAMPHTDRAFTNVLFALHFLPDVLPVLDSLLDCACFSSFERCYHSTTIIADLGIIRWYILHPSSGMGV